MKKRITALALAMTMVLGIAAVAAGTEKTISVTPMTLTVNGQAVTPTKSDGTAAEVFAYDGATYVPLRYLSELLGIDVDWDASDPTTAKLTGDITLPASGGDGTYTGAGSGFGGTITATVTVAGGKITACTLTGDKETPAIGGAALPTLEQQFVAAGSADIDGVSGATFTSDGAKEAVAAALASASASASAPMTFTAGTYTGKAIGYNGAVELNVTFSDSALTKIELGAEGETAHVGTSAYDIMFADAIAANGSGVDAVSGATFTSRAIKEALNDAAAQAGCTNMTAFKSNTVKHDPQAPVEGTWDVVVVGAGGAGMAAAAQAAQNGATVLVIESNAEMGGNTLVSGGAYQTVRSYLVWESNKPDATTGKYDGVTYDKVKSSGGCIDTLRVIAGWSEKAFDEDYYKDHEYVAGDIHELSQHGVHKEYLSTLQTLKKQIKEYLTWADKKMADGAKETDLTLFSTKELHIFQTYYGGLRPSADKTEWIYGDYDLVKQVVDDGQEVDPWLTEQGAVISRNLQYTLIGCLWPRENSPEGGNVAGNNHESKWGTYFKAPENTILTTSKTAKDNKIMTRTTATELITDGDKVVGVKAEMYDGTPVTAYASKGVILATGGYAANIEMVQETNKYWKDEYIADNIGTTNRNSLQGDGIKMGQAVGADTVGMGWTQMMPLGWVDNGNLSRGSGDNVIFINAATGKRYVDEFAERDVLSLGGFENGMSKELAEELGLKYVPGIYVELSSITDNAAMYGPDVEGRQYTWTVDQLAEKLHLDQQVLIDTITEYDSYCMGLTDTISVEKSSHVGLIGSCEKDADGNYLPETYTIDKLFVRFQAPSTHHTMGGLKVNTDRQVLDADGKAISGLWAAGEVTGGIHGGNRLGGNAIVEIIVSGRAAGNSVTGK